MNKLLAAGALMCAPLTAAASCGSAFCTINTSWDAHGAWREPGRSRSTGTSPSSATAGVNFGLKLPTGRIDVRNDEGELAERSLQPGSGTTDAVLAAYYSKHLPLHLRLPQPRRELPLHARSVQAYGFV